MFHRIHDQIDVSVLLFEWNISFGDEMEYEMEYAHLNESNG